jgi:hypothetical protein
MMIKMNHILFKHHYPSTMCFIETTLRNCNSSGIFRNSEDPHFEAIGEAIRKPLQDRAAATPLWLSDALSPFESLMSSHAYLTGDNRAAVRLALRREVATFGDAPEKSLLADLLSAFVE